MEISPDQVKLVATDGHRLALSEYKTSISIDEAKQIIIPRKAVLELSRLLEPSDRNAKIILSQNHIRVEIGTLVFTSKLIDGKFPDYNRVIPIDGNKTLVVDRESLKSAMSRIAILSNEKYRGIRLTLTSGNLSIQANNPDQEEAEELDSAIESSLAKIPDGIDGKIIRLRIFELPRDIYRELDHKKIREYRTRALHFHLDTKPPKAVRHEGSAAPGRRFTLEEELAAFLKGRWTPSSKSVDMEELVQLGVRYLREAEDTRALENA